MIGRRIVAALADGALLAAIIVAVGAITGSHATGTSDSSAIVYPLIGLAYFFASEATTGQTVGKRLLGIRVTALDGRRALVGAVLIRTLFRPIDGLGGYLVGLIAILATRRRQRLGDVFGRTLVVRVQH